MVERLNPLLPFGHLIRSRRQRVGLTQQHLAERLGVHQVSVSDWETGKNLPKAPVIAQLKAELGIGDHEIEAALLSEDDVVRALRATTAISARVRDALITLYRDAVMAHRNDVTQGEEP